jgi:hypothetical protein
MTDSLVDAEIRVFVKERDEMLLACDIDRCIAFHTKYNPGIKFPSREIAEVAMHKARTAVVTLPKEERQKSKAWLKQHGMDTMPFDDGDLD